MAAHRSTFRLWRPVYGRAAGSHRQRALAPAVRAEPERWDGSGYPDGLSGQQIPLASRITLACEAPNAMASDRPYRSAIHPPARL